MSKAELVKQLLKLYDIAYDDAWTEDYENILLESGPDAETETIEDYLNLMSESQLAAAYRKMLRYQDGLSTDLVDEYLRIKNAPRVSEYEQGWADGFEDAYSHLGYKI